MRILVDMDDTLENLCETWVEYLNEMYGTDVEYKDVTEWDMTKAFPDLTRNQIYGVLSDESLWERVTPLPGAQKYLKKLIDDGHDVYIVTASHPDTVSVKSRMLFRYFPYLTYDKLVVCSDKFIISGDVLIDDNPENLKSSSCEYTILFDSPHNRWFRKCTRAYYWKQVYRCIEEIQPQHYLRR